jgi:glycosyltransferase involved in cell wall biosynthesis
MSDLGGLLAGNNILALTKYAANGASSRLRTMQYIPALEAAGATVTLSSFFDAAYIDRLYSGGARSKPKALSYYSKRAAALLSARQYDLLWIEKELFPYLPGVIERLFSGWARRPYIVDYDDAIFHNYDLNPRSWIRGLLGQKLDPLLCGATAVTAGNAYLADYARKHGAPRVVDLPTVVDIDRYNMVPSALSGEVRVGWIGTPSTVKYLVRLLPVLAQVARSTPIRLVTIGAPPIVVPEALALEQLVWSEAGETQALAGFDIGIMPLPDEPFERGKCGYKLIQYMASGRPVIASAVGANREIVTPDCGMLASSPEQWRAALTQLSADRVLMQKMGAAGRQKVERQYSMQVTAPRLISLIKQVLSH